MAVAMPASAPVEAPGPQPVDFYIQRALAENRAVRAAWFNVQAVKHRIPQVTALDDPVISNTIFPIPSIAPQFSLMGYMPYDALLAQQFPWFGTLRLRGEAAVADVKVALYELAATQLDAIAAVKRAYHDLAFAERAERLLVENRALAEDFLKIAQDRYQASTATQADVLRAETAVADIDRELETTRQAVEGSRAELARLIHVSPESKLEAMPEVTVGAVPPEVERLYPVAVSARPELQGRQAAIARDRAGIELARKRGYPNVTVGVVYQGMERRNAVTPETAAGMPNVGLFVGFNLPIYREKVAAGVCEAQARAVADAALYESERDQAHREIKDAYSQARALENVLGLMKRSNLPNTRQVFQTTASDFAAGNVDFLALFAAWRDVLQVELQVAQTEAELGKALATLERAVGVRIIEPAPSAPETPTAAPPPTEGPGPFAAPEEERDDQQP
jgi:outer membrane protein TolC